MVSTPSSTRTRQRICAPDRSSVTSHPPEVDGVERIGLEPVGEVRLVERIDERAGAGLDDIGRGAVPRQRFAVHPCLERYLPQAVAARRDGLDGEVAHLDRLPDDLAHRRERGGDRAITLRLGLALTGPRPRHPDGRGAALRAAHHAQVRELVLLGASWKPSGSRASKPSSRISRFLSAALLNVWYSPS